MSGSASNYGLALYEYVERFWIAEGLTQNAWALKHGVAGPQLIRWRSGQIPGIDSLERVAEVTGRPLIDVLVGIGLVTSAEAGGHAVVIPQPPSTGPLNKILDLADDVTDAERVAIKDTTEVLLRTLRGGKGGKVTIRN